MSISPQNAADIQSLYALAMADPFKTAVVLLMVLAVAAILIGCKTIIVEAARNVTNRLLPATTPTPAAKNKDVVNILVIDDQHRSFSLGKILSDKDKYPWISYASVADLDSMTQQSLVDADLVFVDINNVGKKLTPITQGLGLAEEILNRYPKKTVVLYSSDIKQDMTHPVLSRVAGRLYKEDEPRNFIKYAEDLRRKLD
jgi:hypothetical protein